MQNHQRTISKFYSKQMLFCVLPDDVTALHDLSLIDDKRWGEPDDVSMGGLGQQPAVPQPQAHLHNSNSQIRSLCLIDDKGRGQPDDVSVGGLGQQPSVPQPQAHLRNSNSQISSLHLLMTRGRTSLMISPWVGFASTPRSLSLRHTYAIPIVSTEVSTL
jgi:hypothetical protein